MAFAKRYYSKIAGAKFVQPDGTEMFFLFGRLDFEPKHFPGTYQSNTQHPDPRNGKLKADVYQDELEALVNQKGGNPLIYTAEQVSGIERTPDPMPTKIPSSDGRVGDVKGDLARSAAEIVAGDAAMSRQGKTQVTGDLNTAHAQLDPNASTVDHQLRTRVADFDKGEDKAAAIRKQIEDRAALSAQSTSR